MLESPRQASGQHDANPSWKLAKNVCAKGRPAGAHQRGATTRKESFIQQVRRYFPLLQSVAASAKPEGQDSSECPRLRKRDREVACNPAVTSEGAAEPELAQPTPLRRRITGKCSPQSARRTCDRNAATILPAANDVAQPPQEAPSRSPAPEAPGAPHTKPRVAGSLVNFCGSRGGSYPPKSKPAPADQGTWHSEPQPTGVSRPTEAFRYIEDESAIKRELIERLIRLTFLTENNEKDARPEFHLPADGRFQNEDHYISTWANVVIREMESHVLSEVGRVVAAPAATAPHNAASMARMEAGCWQLEPLCGEWMGSNGRRLRIVSGAAGDGRQLCVANDEWGWCASLGSPESLGGWRVARAHGHEEWVRLQAGSFNVLESGQGLLRRSPAELRLGAIVFVSAGRQGSSGNSLGVVESSRRPGSGLSVRFRHDALNHSCEWLTVHLLPGINITSSSRELQAVRAYRSLQQELKLGIMTGLPPSAAAQKRLSRAPLPCVQKLNISQKKAVEAAFSQDAGFTLLWGPPGTGKSSTLVALVNALHVREYEKVHKHIENIILGPQNASKEEHEKKWKEAVSLAPRILVTASSNAAVDGLLERVCREQFVDRHGHCYTPWSIIRVGALTRESTHVHDLDANVSSLLEMPQEEVTRRLAEVQKEMQKMKSTIHQLREGIAMLQAVTPLPEGWEARLDGESRRVVFHDHTRRKATYKHPGKPSAGSPRVELLRLPEAVDGFTKLIRCADRWWQLDHEERRLKLLNTSRVDPAFARQLREKLQQSLLGSAHIVFSTLSSAARMLAFIPHCQPFGAVVIDEAAQATEPAVLIPLHLARARTCVLVGDDRQLPPTVFSAQAEDTLVARPLFERLRQLGYKAHLLEEQYRMAPEISAFPRAYFYDGALRDGPNMRERTRRSFHAAFPPFFFLDLASSAAQVYDKSFRNRAEAQVCARVLQRVFEVAARFGEAKVAMDVGIITPYRAQQQLLQQELSSIKSQTLPTGVVQTVDAYQGRECEVIVFSAVRAPQAAVQSEGMQRGPGRGIGFLADERRLNVALTRAKALMIVVGHAATLCRSPAWKALIQHAKEHGVLFHLPSVEVITNSWTLCGSLQAS